MKKILIDGSFFGKPVTGVQRFCRKTLQELSQIPDLKIYVAVAEDIDTQRFPMQNVEFVRKGKKNNKFWQLITLGRIAKKMKLPVLGMANFTPLFKKDFLVLHDVTFLDKEGKNRFLWSLAYRIFVGFRIRRHKKIFTVSEFSKSRILHHYKKLKNEQVVVVGNGGGGLKGTEEAKPELKHLDDFFLSVGSSSANKNFEYVIHLAEQNPAKNFIVTGKIYTDYTEIAKRLPNVQFTGYLSDEELHYLYSHCNGFILPSLYEGFGLPPLEALSCGCRKIIVSDIPVFREVYGNVANFFDPYDYAHTVSLENLKSAGEAETEQVLRKYSWENTARIIYENLE